MTIKLLILTALEFGKDFVGRIFLWGELEGICLGGIKFFTYGLQFTTNTKLPLVGTIKSGFTGTDFFNGFLLFIFQNL